MESPLTLFTRTAADYRRYRPSYPSALFEWIERESGARAPALVLDVGAGTGIVSRLLSSRGYDVVGVEPNERMLQTARLDESPARYVRAQAEATGLASGRFELAVSGQAFHWFDLERALTELARVLAPGAWTAAFWNVRGSGGIALDYDAVLRRHSEIYARAAGTGSRRPGPEPSGPEPPRSGYDELRAHIGERELRETRIEYEVELDLESLLGRARSASYVAHGVADLDAFARDLGAAFDRYAERGRVVFPYSTIALMWR